MASYLVIFSAPEEHIQFMRNHSGTSRNYYMGELPELKSPKPEKQSLIDKLLGRKFESPEPEPIEIPADWPRDEAF